MNTHESESNIEWLNVRGPSKSSRKRHSTALQDLGQELMALTQDQLARLGLPDELYHAVRLAGTIKARGGLQRQRRFVGKLLRGMDPDPIRAALDELRGIHAHQIRQLHECERWRDRLLAEGDAAIDQFVGEYPRAERVKLRQLVRDAGREASEQRPPHSSRRLFRHLRELMAAGAEQATDPVFLPDSTD